jgi:hypothetical protein
MATGAMKGAMEWQRTSSVAMRLLVKDDGS